MDILNERLVNLREIKQYLLEERNFAIRQKDWPRVTVFRQKLRQHSEQVAMVLHMKGEINRGA
jgi:hypothetical protein